MPHYDVIHTCGHSNRYLVDKYADIKLPYYQKRKAWQQASECPTCWRRAIRDEITARTGAVPITGVSDRQIALAARVRGDALEVLLHARDCEPESSPRRAQLDEAICKISGSGDARWLLATLPRDYYRSDPFAKLSTQIVEEKLLEQFAPALPKS